MKNLFRKLYHKRHDLSVTDILLIKEAIQHVKHVGKRTFKVLWTVCNADNGYTTMKTGFSTEREAKDYAYTLSCNWFIYPYEIEMK